MEGVLGQAPNCEVQQLGACPQNSYFFGFALARFFGAVFFFFATLRAAGLRLGFAAFFLAFIFAFGFAFTFAFAFAAGFRFGLAVRFAAG